MLLDIRIFQGINDPKTKFSDLKDDMLTYLELETKRSTLNKGRFINLSVHILLPCQVNHILGWYNLAYIEYRPQIIRKMPPSDLGPKHSNKTFASVTWLTVSRYLRRFQELLIITLKYEPKRHLTSNKHNNSKGKE